MAIKRPNNLPPKKGADEPRVNQEITAPNIRLIGEDGEMSGVVSVAEGMAKAREAGMDLVEISPSAKPPVCKVMDYGKYKYQKQKKAQEAKKKQKPSTSKKLSFARALTPMIWKSKCAMCINFLMPAIR
jgi:translation initiation factor IF-3